MPEAGHPDRRVVSFAGAVRGRIKKAGNLPGLQAPLTSGQTRGTSFGTFIGRLGEDQLIRSCLMTSAMFVSVVVAAHAQDAATGEKAFVVCRACHQIGPGAKVAIGPVLNGIVGRKAGTYPGYAYSDANKNSGIVWTPKELETYLANPQKVIPNTKMAFPGLPSEQKRKDVVAYLEQFNDDGTRKQ